ncbi:hypothetical protein [Glaciimonas sp. PCH181]|uniref:hypothetical protein n=1 Tax=Glaciimonas sp. PCH181 TaxID=2133943 RepID=UPI001CEC4971|nr:hypothetical protein [Glaciimonas sp. PCH181]
MISTVLRQTLRVGMVGAALVLAGCGKKVLDFRNAEIANGKIFSSGANSPFSGQVTNIDIFKIPNLNNGASPILKTLNSLIGASLYSDEYITLGDLCDVNVKDGILQGKGLCKAVKGDNVISEFSFENGVLQNHFKMFSKTSEFVIAEADFDSGRLDEKCCYPILIMDSSLPKQNLKKESWMATSFVTLWTVNTPFTKGVS